MISRRRLPVSAFFVWLLGACSFDGSGASVSKVTVADGGRVLQTRSLGFAFRTTSEDLGMSLGYTYSFVLVPESHLPQRTGNHLFGIREPSGPEGVQIRHVYGLDIAMNRRITGASLGFLEDAILTRTPAQSSVARQIVLDTVRPERSYIATFPAVIP
jgi:hypothetical protein